MSMWLFTTRSTETYSEFLIWSSNRIQTWCFWDVRRDFSTTGHVQESQTRPRISGTKCVSVQIHSHPIAVQINRLRESGKYLTIEKSQLLAVRCGCVAVKKNIDLQKMRSDVRDSQIYRIFCRPNKTRCELLGAEYSTRVVFSKCKFQLKVKVYNPVHLPPNNDIIISSASGTVTWWNAATGTTDKTTSVAAGGTTNTPKPFTFLLEDVNISLKEGKTNGGSTKDVILSAHLSCEGESCEFTSTISNYAPDYYTIHIGTLALVFFSKANHFFSHWQLSDASWEPAREILSKAKLYQFLWDAATNTWTCSPING